MIKLSDFVQTYDFPSGQEIVLTDCGNIVEIFRCPEEYDCFGHRYQKCEIERHSYDRESNRVTVQLQPEASPAPAAW